MHYFICDDVAVIDFYAVLVSGYVIGVVAVIVLRCMLLPIVTAVMVVAVVLTVPVVHVSVGAVLALGDIVVTVIEIAIKAVVIVVTSRCFYHTCFV